MSFLIDPAAHHSSNRPSVDRRPSTDSRVYADISGMGENDDEPNAGNPEIPEEKPLVHRVEVPPHQTLVKGIEGAVKETFFPDDPLRQFKNQPTRKRIILGLQYVFPILDWLPKYKWRAHLRGDIIAGLTIASLAVPQDLGYAKLANLDPVYGLYSSFVPPLVYAVLGSSRDIAIGPVAVVSILLGTLLKNELDPKKQKAEYLQLALTSTFFAGVFQAALGFLRLGFIIDFLSHAAIVGFMAGAAITIALQQLKGLFGITNFTTKTDVISVMRSVWTNIDEWSWRSILLGLFFLAFLLITKQIGARKKKLFWVAAMAPLASVIMSTLFVYLTRLDKHNVKIVGHIHQGINPSSRDQLIFSGTLLKKGVTIGLVAGLIALTEAIAIGRTFATLKDYHIDGNKEMIAFGLMNIFGSLSSCYVATGSFSRSAVNFNAGCHTALTNIVMSVVLMFTLLFLTPLFKYTPNTILSAIIISAVISLIDFKAAALIFRVDKVDFLACLGAFVGVFFVSVEIGLLVAVVISMLKILFHVTRPHTAILGNIPGTTVYRNLEQYPDAVQVPGILIERIDAAIYFSNSSYLRERTLRWVDDESDRRISAGEQPIQYLIIELTPVTSIDTTGIHAFEELNQAMAKRGIQLALANPVSSVMSKLIASKFHNLVGQEWFFLTVGEAVQVCQSVQKRTFVINQAEKV